MLSQSDLLSACGCSYCHYRSHRSQDTPEYDYRWGKDAMDASMPVGARLRWWITEVLSDLEAVPTGDALVVVSYHAIPPFH